MNLEVHVYNYMVAQENPKAQLHHVFPLAARAFCGRNMAGKTFLIDQRFLDTFPYERWCRKCIAVIDRS